MIDAQQLRTRLADDLSALRQDLIQEPGHETAIQHLDLIYPEALFDIVVSFAGDSPVGEHHLETFERRATPASPTPFGRVEGYVGAIVGLAEDLMQERGKA